MAIVCEKNILFLKGMVYLVPGK